MNRSETRRDFFCRKMQSGISAIALYRERAIQDKQETTYNGTDEAIIVRVNEHYCQHDVDKNNRTNHEIPRACSKANVQKVEKNRAGRSIDLVISGTNRQQIARESLIVRTAIYYLSSYLDEDLILINPAKFLAAIFSICGMREREERWR